MLPTVARFYHKRTKKTIEVPDDEAHLYDNARYERIESAAHLVAGQDWEPANVPDGTVAEVLEWVGDNDLRRQSALTVERAGKNRTTLIKALESGAAK